MGKDVEKSGMKGKLQLKPIEFSDVIVSEVKRANATSGRIYLPEKYIGKKVYVLVDEG